MTTLQKRSTTLFSPGRSLLGEEGEGAIRPKGLFGAHERVVPRADCQYRRLDFSSIPVRRRAAAARLAVARFEPATSARTHVAWQGGIAHYWIWTPQEEDANRPRRWIPESLLRAAPDGDAVRLVRMRRGVEGQVWRGGVLQASQWWADRPEVQSWQHFVRAAGLATDDTDHVPEPLELDWSDTAWAEDAGGSRIDADSGERLAWKAALLLFLCALGWQLTSLGRWQAAGNSEAKRLESARLRAGPLLDARERAETAASSIDGLLQLQKGVSDYELMADVAEMLPEGALLSAWNRDPARLRILVKSSETDPRRFIERFAAMPMLADLTATPTGSGNMVLEFNLPQHDAGGAGE